MSHINMKVLAVTALSVASLAAHAADGTVNITGNVSATTCTVLVNGTAASTSVALPIVGTSALAAPNSAAGIAPFYIGLTGCTTGQASMVPYFEAAGSSTFNAAGRMDTSVPNVEIQIISSLGAPVNLNGSATVVAGVSGQNIPVVAFTGANPNRTATSDFIARYYSTNGSAGSGAVTVNLAYSITYQ